MKPGKITVTDYLARWLQDYAKPNLSPRGYERYESIVRIHLILAIGIIQLTQLRPNHLQKHYSAMLAAGLSPRSVSYHHVVLHKALSTALKWGLVMRNVADGVEIPRASTIFIMGNVGNLAAGVDQTITHNTIVTVTENNLESLRQFLTGIGLTKEDIFKLEESINKDEHGFGDNVQTWLSKAIIKVGTGAKKIGVSVAAHLITKAIELYLGM